MSALMFKLTVFLNWSQSPVSRDFTVYARTGREQKLEAKIIILWIIFIYFFKIVSHFKSETIPFNLAFIV